jgi:hypothetical protein
MSQRNPSPGELAHYGVKGMKWGVKKARTGDLRKGTILLDKVAAGKGTPLENMAVIQSSRWKDLSIKNGGFRGGAARRSAELKAEHDRIANGKATTKDMLRAYGGVSIFSIAASAHKKSDHER